MLFISSSVTPPSELVYDFPSPALVYITVSRPVSLTERSLSVPSLLQVPQLVPPGSEQPVLIINPTSSMLSGTFTTTFAP